MANTAPPDDTKEETLHFLWSGGIRSMFLWKSGKWEVPFTDYGTVPEILDRYGWHYSHPASPTRS